MKKIKFNIDRIFDFIIIILSVEFVVLPFGLTFFKVLILPLATIGTFLILKEPISKDLTVKIAVLYFVLIGMTLTGLASNNVDPLITAIGLFPFVTFISGYLYIRGWKDRHTIIVSLFSIPHFIAYVSYYLGYYSSAFTLSSWTPRFTGLHTDPNFLAFYVLIALSAKLFLFSIYKIISYRLLIVAGVLIDIFMIALSVSRGALVTLLFFIVFFSVLRLGVLRSTISIIIGTVVSSLLFTSLNLANKVVLYWSRRLSNFDFSKLLGSDNMRLRIWEDAYHYIEKGSFFWGRSLSSFVKEIGHFPHNTFIDAFLESGPLYGIVFIALVIYCFIKTFIKYEDTRHLKDEYRIYFVFVSCVSLMFLSYFSTKIFWFSICLLIVTSSRSKEYNKIV